MSKRDEFVNKLRKAYEKMKNDKNTYEVFEQLEESRGVGNYKNTFIARKKGGFGFFKAVVDLAQSAAYGGVEGLFWRATRTAAERIEGPMLEPIRRDFKGYEIAMIMKRWSETVPQGFIETIGNTVTLPDDDSWIAYEINPGKEMRVIIDFVRIKGEAPTKEEYEAEEAEEVPEAKEIGKIMPMAPAAPATASMPMMPYPGMLDEIAKRAYLAGSLRNVEGGFTFDLLNPFGDVSLIGPITLIVNETKIPVENIRVRKGGETIYSGNISSAKPLKFVKSEKITVEVSGANLETGKYNLKINTVVDGMGSLSIQVEDNI